MPPVIPAELAFAGDGTPFSPLFDDIYHSGQGGIGQAHHVFLAGNHLPQRWSDRASFVIFETGFGLGLNFLATWQAWRESDTKGRLHFISTEMHPFRRDDLAGLLAAYPELADMSGHLLRQWPSLAPGFHRLSFDGGQVTLTLLLGDAQTLLPQLVATVDAVFLDGFSPAKNPGMWSPDLLMAITRRCRPGATLATWSVAGEVCRVLESIGWQLERRPGYATKREMLAGVRPGAVSPVPTSVPTRTVIVIGAGLAGSAISECLARRGWHIDIFERHDGPAREASGNPTGILLPHLAKDDALAARLSRACYLYALRRLADLAGVRWSPCGVLQIARDAAHEIQQRATIEQLKLPSDFAAFFERDEAARLVGREVAHGGWWFPHGGWVSPGSVCATLLAACGAQMHLHFGSEVAALRKYSGGWQAIGSHGDVLANATHVILANAHAANLLLSQALPLTPIRGQISCLSHDMAARIDPPFHHVLCRSGYVTPPQAGIVCVGASFDSDDTDLNTRLADHVGNMQRLDELLPGAAQGIDAAKLGGRVGLRCAAPDRLPLVGLLPDTTAVAGNSPSLDNLPREAGLHALLGLSARGMVWAPLAAELLASQMNGDPLPMEHDLARAVDPARFHLRALRRGKTGL